MCLYDYTYIRKNEFLFLSLKAERVTNDVGIFFYLVRELVSRPVTNNNMKFYWIAKRC
ncbi:hypothetical protein Hanom_Chr12g01135311 [Helianthus anomalus]